MHCHYFKVLIKSVAVLAFPFVCNMSQNKGNSMREVLREKKKKFYISNNPDSIFKRKYGGMFNQNKRSRGNLSRLDHLTRPLCPYSLYLHRTECMHLV